MESLLAHLDYPMRVAFILAVVVTAHVVVVIVRSLGIRLMAALPKGSFTKGRSIASLLTSIVIFGLYFVALGVALKEIGVSLKAYLASASVVGLAIGFGSQGLVQDVVTGITLIFSDIIDVDDMVEISGQVGIVQAIGMRFIALKNPLGAEAFIPNRTITNVINYPRGYIRCLVDVSLNPDAKIAQEMVKRVFAVVSSTYEQFRGIFIYPPSSEGVFKTRSGKRFLRIKFRIWPGRGTILETVSRQEIVQRFKELDPNYADWMISVGYEVEKTKVTVPSGGLLRKRKRPARRKAAGSVQKQ